MPVQQRQQQHMHCEMRTTPMLMMLLGLSWKVKRWRAINQLIWNSPEPVIGPVIASAIALIPINVLRSRSMPDVLVPCGNSGACKLAGDGFDAWAFCMGCFTLWGTPGA